MSDPTFEELIRKLTVAKVGPDAPTEDGSGILRDLLDTGNDDVDAVEPDEGDLASLQTEFDSVARLTARKRELESELQNVSRALQAQKDRMLMAMEAQGTKQFRSALGDGSCTITERYDTTVEDPQTFLAWVTEAHPELLTVNSQTRNKFIRENYRDQGIDPDSPEFPPGVQASPRRSLMVRDVKAAK